MLELKMIRRIRLLRTRDILNAIVPSWPVLQDVDGYDPWDPQTHEDARLTERERYH